MAKREISSTLKNLKFMQRGAAREEKPKQKEEEEVKPNGNFCSRGGVRKCMVVMEGDPHPGAVIGRMSFRSFNPSVDKLNGVATNPEETASQAASSARENGSSAANGSESSPNSDGGDQKWKQPDVASERENSNTTPRGAEGGEGSSRNTKKGSFRQKRQKLDFNALRAKTRNN